MQRPKIEPIKVEGLGPGPPSVQGHGLPSSAEGASSSSTVPTPAPITPSIPSEGHETYLQRDEMSPQVSLGLQERTADLIAKVQAAAPGLGEGEVGVASPGGLSLERLSLGAEDGANKVLKELETAKASLDRAQAMLLAFQKVQTTDTSLQEKGVRELLMQALRLLEQAEALAAGRGPAE